MTIKLVLNENEINGYLLDDSQFTWEIVGGVDKELFELINKAFDEFALILKNPMDFENPIDNDKNNIYEVTLESLSINYGTYETQEYEFTVRDIEDWKPFITGPSGEINSNLEIIEIPENSTFNLDDYFSFTTDQGNNEISYKLTSNEENFYLRFDDYNFQFYQQLDGYRANLDYERPLDSDKNNIYSTNLEVTSVYKNNPMQSPAYSQNLELQIKVTDLDDTDPAIYGPGDINQILFSM